MTAMQKGCSAVASWQAKTDRALGRSVGWSSPVVVEIAFLAISLRDNGTTIPSETVELYWLDVKKIFFRR